MNRAPSIDYGIGLLRVSLGLMFLAHSVVLKLMTYTLPGTAAFFVSVGLPGWLAYATFAAEAVGGAMLVLGVQARWVALALSPVMVGAMQKVSLSMSSRVSLAVRVAAWLTSPFRLWPPQAGTPASTSTAGPKSPSQFGQPYWPRSRPKTHPHPHWSAGPNGARPARSCPSPRRGGVSRRTPSRSKSTQGDRTLL